MQLSARILTALAVLAFAVAIVAGATSANDEVSAATGTIDAMNVGACTTTNADVLGLAHCTQKNAFFQQKAIKAAIEVDNLYATYAFDPKNGGQSPRAILEDSDLIRISVKDSGRDRRDPVLVTSAQSGFNDGPCGGDTGDNTNDGDPITSTGELHAGSEDCNTDDDTNDPVPAKVPVVSAKKVVSDATGIKVADLPDLEDEVKFDRVGVDDNTTFTITAGSGSKEIRFDSTDGTDTGDDADKFKAIASKADGGVIKFFGRVKTGDTLGDFMDLKEYVSIDEDVISGGPDTPPAMTILVDVPQAANSEVQIQVISYQTSEVEFLQGADASTTDDGGTPADTTDDTKVDIRCGASAAVNPQHQSTNARVAIQAQCTADEIKNKDTFVLYAETDTDIGESKRQLALVETGRFTGVFQGYLRLTDPNGNAALAGGADNWGRMATGAAYDHLSTNTGKNDASSTANPTVAVARVEGSGDPVTITYKDSGGTTRTFSVEIDYSPPTIDIDSPLDGARSDDEKPSFIGTFNDSESGLAANSFQLDVDNKNDPANDDPVLKYGSGITNSCEPPAGKDYAPPVTNHNDYTYGSDAVSPVLYGVLSTGTRGTDTSRTAPRTYFDIYKTRHDPSGWNPDDKHVEADDFADGALDGEFNDEIEIDFDEDEDQTTWAGFNNAVDFQAIVRDLAGNIGFSDSDTASPRRIDALGADKKADCDAGPAKHNVLGVFSSHVVWIDEIDPTFEKTKSVTGFSGLDKNKNLTRDASSVMVVFDNAVNGDLIDTGTFTLEHADGSAIEIADVSVNKQLVFLALGEDLASDAMPKLSITEGREVEDMAGNILSWKEKDATAFKLKDGILPVLTLTLSEGSGTGSGSEGPSMLTAANMNFDIMSDEDLTGSPKVAVVCSNINWDHDNDATTDNKKLADYVNNRTGVEAVEGPEKGLMCGSATEPEDFGASLSLSRPGNNWVYAWRNASSDNMKRHLNDGSLVAVVWARDRNDYMKVAGIMYDGKTIDDGEKAENYGSVKATFTLDNTFHSPLNADGSGGSVQPDPGSKVKEPRPFIYLDFAGEPTSVTPNKFTVDGVDQLGSLSTVGDNRFLYWPDDLEYGEHEVVFDARDAADNKPTGKTSFKFNVTARDPFVLDLAAGWNAISFPANPVDTAIDAVFTDPAVDRVVGWNPMNATGAWGMASRTDGVWGTEANAFPLTDVEVRYGYWVHSTAFVKQSVQLEGPINRETGGKPNPIGIATVPGWNFIGVVDQDGDQTEDHWGKVLKDSEGTAMTAATYMPGYVQAYTWDGIDNGYRALAPDGDIIIGKGIWVFFSEIKAPPPPDNTIAP